MESLQPGNTLSLKVSSRLGRGLAPADFGTLPNLDCVIEKCSANLFEPMRRAVGYDDHVAFGQLAGLAILDTRAANLVCRYFLHLLRRTAGHKGSRAFHHVNDVGVERVNFSQTGFVATTGVDHVVTVSSVEQNGAFGERC